jgi:hypothetical protein
MIACKERKNQYCQMIANTYEQRYRRDRKVAKMIIDAQLWLQPSTLSATSHLIHVQFLMTTSTLFSSSVFYSTTSWLGSARIKQ